MRVTFESAAKYGREKRPEDDGRQGLNQELIATIRLALANVCQNATKFKLVAFGAGDRAS